MVMFHCLDVWLIYWFLSPISPVFLSWLQNYIGVGLGSNLEARLSQDQEQSREVLPTLTNFSVLFLPISEIYILLSESYKNSLV